MIKLNRKTLIVACCCGIFTIFMASRVVEAQEICAEEEALSALSQLPCIADGFYISPAALAMKIASSCGEADTRQLCNRCFRKSFKRTTKTLRDLSRLELLDKDWILAVKTAILESQEATCAAIQSPNFPDDLINPQGGDSERNRWR